MSLEKLPEDRQVLREKFNAAHRICSARSIMIALLKQSLTQVAFVDDDASNEELAEVLPASLPLNEAPADRSLLREHIRRLRPQMGKQWEEKGAKWFREFRIRRKRVRELLTGRCFDPWHGSLKEEIERFLRALISLKEAKYEPHERLRDELHALLNRAPKERIETRKQELRRIRDARIRDIAKEHNTYSPSAVMRIAVNDESIRALLEKDPKLIPTIDKVRAALLPRQKTAPSKKTKMNKDFSGDL